MTDRDDHDDRNDRDIPDTHHEPDEAPTMPPASTEVFPRVRTGDATRLDVHRVYDVPDPTREVRAVPEPHVSPIGVHTRGAAATTPPYGTDVGYQRGAPMPPVPPEVATLNQLLDDRDRIAADTRTAWAGRRLFRTDRHKARTVREEAARRAREKLRHERHLEIVETIRAYFGLVIIFCLLVIVVGAGFVGWGILSGMFTWELVRTP